MAYRDLVMADNPSLYWRLGESAGTNANDETTNNIDGTYTGTPTLGITGLVPGESDTAVDFNVGESGVGTDYCRSASIASIWNALSAFSVEVWVKPSGTPTGHIVRLPHQVFQERNALLVDSTGVIQVAFYDNIGGNTKLFGTTILQADETYHIVWTIEDNEYARLYVNCSLEDEHEMGSTFDRGDTGFYPWATLADTDDTGVQNRFRGTIDEFAFYNSVLSSARITSHGCPRICELNADDEALFVDASTGSITVKLFPHDPLAQGPIRYIKRVDGTSNTVTINPSPTTIDRRTSMVLMPRDALALITDGTEWWTL